MLITLLELGAQLRAAAEEAAREKNNKMRD
jgi:hypothetical protein